MKKDRARYYRIFSAIGLGVALSLPLVFSISQASSSSGPARAFKEMQAEAKGSLKVRWDRRTLIPTSLRGAIPYNFDAAEQAAPYAGAINFLSRYRSLFRMTDPAQELSLQSLETDALGQTHVRMNQLYQGVPVFHRSLYVHVGAGGEVLGVNGHFEPGLDVDPEPALGAEAAEALAIKAAGGDDPRVTQPASLVVHVARTGEATLAWKVQIETSAIVDREDYFVAARGGAIIATLPATMLFKDRSVYDAHETEDAEQISQEGEIPDDDAGEAAYKNAGTVYDYYFNTFGRDSFDDQGGTINLIVHSPELGNSFWNGEALWFGDEDDVITDKSDALVLDILAHEFTHAVTQYSANLEYISQSGALNESFSDVFAVLVDRQDWHLFEDNTKCSTLPKNHCWLRDMQDPTLGGDFPDGDFGQPATMDDYVVLPEDRKHDNGGVHVNSGIPNYTFYLAVTASSKEGMEQVWYRALTNYLTETSDFDDFADALTASADDLFGAGSEEAEAVQSALEQVGILGGGSNTQPPTPTATARGGSGNPTPQPTPRPAAGCDELIDNGGFEARRPDPWVEMSAAGLEIISAERPHAGNNSAWIGGSDEESFQYLYQDIDVPDNAKSVTLTYWRLLHEELVKSSAKEATFSAVVANADGDILEVLEELSSTQGDDKWAQATLDLSAYAGDSIRLAFSADMVRNNVSSLFVDDVSLMACTKSGGSTSTGTAVQVQGQVTNGSTSKGIEGATVYILKPGLTVKQVAADGKITKDEYIASAVTDKKGNYILPDRLPRGQNYGVIIIAKGYKTAGGDAILKFDSQTQSPFTLNGKLDKSF